LKTSAPAAGSFTGFVRPANSAGTGSNGAGSLAPPPQAASTIALNTKIPKKTFFIVNLQLIYAAAHYSHIVKKVTVTLVT
jgi:hypothetical protein